MDATRVLKNEGEAKLAADRAQEIDKIITTLQK